MSSFKPSNGLLPCRLRRKRRQIPSTGMGRDRKVHYQLAFEWRIKSLGNLNENPWT